MTGTDLCVNKPHKSRSYLNHLVVSKLLLGKWNGSVWAEFVLFRKLSGLCEQRNEPHSSVSCEEFLN